MKIEFRQDDGKLIFTTSIYSGDVAKFASTLLAAAFDESVTFTESEPPGVHVGYLAAHVGIAERVVTNGTE